MTASEAWPSLPLSDWQETYATLHMWTQIVGKLRLAQTPWVNHSWHIPLYVTARGLTTSPIPYGTRTFQVDFDFIAHQLLIQTSEGAGRTIALEARSVAAFCRSTSTRDPTRSIRPSRSPRTARMRPMTRSTPSASGACSSSLTAC